jgi:imidazole glycerol-phosphate synthase subunit HisH
MVHFLKGLFMVAIIDYHMGNLHSVLKACTLAGLEPYLATRASQVKRARAVILPGVGAFGQAMAQLKRRGLIQSLKQYSKTGRPLLGVCLGMQLLFEVSYEHGTHKGLGLISGEVVHFPQGLKVPHMGWNQLIIKKRHAYFSGLKTGSYMYFVHSFYCRPKYKENLIVSSEYGLEFAAAAAKNNLCGVQFHPEKSQEQGLAIYRNLARQITAKG